MVRGFLGAFTIVAMLLEMVLGNVPTPVVHWFILIIATCAGIVGAASN